MATGWRKRQIADLRSEIDEFQEVMATRILIEEDIAMIEAMIITFPDNAEELQLSLKIAREKLKNYESTN